MRKYLALIICLGVAGSSFDIHAITAWGQFKTMIKTGLLTGGSLFAWLKFVNNSKDYCTFIDKDGKALDETIAAIGAGSIASFCALYCSSYYTPSYTYEWALRLRDELKQYVLFKYSITAENMKDMRVACGAESDPYPYVSMFNKLADYDKKVGGAIDWLTSALKDSDDTSVLGIQIKALRDDFNNDLVRIRNNEQMVKCYDPSEWIRQFTQYNDSCLREKYIQAMNAPQLHAGYSYHHVSR